MLTKLHNYQQLHQLSLNNRRGRFAAQAHAETVRAHSLVDRRGLRTYLPLQTRIETSEV